MLYWVHGMHPVHPPSHYPLAGPAGLALCHEKLTGEALLAFLSRPGGCCENELPGLSSRDREKEQSRESS